MLRADFTARQLAVAVGLLIMGGSFLPGCSSGGDELTRHAISGEVTFQGNLVPHGLLTFEPDSSQGNTGPASQANIQNGTFAVPAQRGVIGGSYLVRLSGYKAGAGQAGADDNWGDPLFEDLELRLNLPANKSVHDFHLPISEP